MSAASKPRAERARRRPSNVIQFPAKAGCAIDDPVPISSNHANLICACEALLRRVKNGETLTMFVMEGKAGPGQSWCAGEYVENLPWLNKGLAHSLGQVAELIDRAEWKG